MSRMLLLLLLFMLFFGYVGADSVSAQSAVSVSATVMPVRYIYLNQQGQIYKIIGNTSQDITPSVISFAGQPLAMTSAIWQQYNHWLTSYGSFQVGIAYSPPVSAPITTNNGNRGLELIAAFSATAQLGSWPEFLLIPLRSKKWLTFRSAHAFSNT